MSWQTVGLLKAVLCSAAIGLVVIVYLMHRLQGRAYNRHIRTALVVLAVLGAGAYINFGRFHGSKYAGPIHWYDMYHYYMGAKYFPELHYDGLYAATVVADDEDRQQFRGARGVQRIRDLREDRLIPVREVLAEQEAIRGQFRPARWEQFKQDIRFFQAHTAAATWRDMLSDFGFNGPPVWLLAGGILSRLSNTGQYWQVMALAWLDVALMAGAFYFVYRAFGLPTACLAIVFFGINYTQRYEHMSGSLLRLDWLAWLLIGVSLVKLGWLRSAGFFVAYAALLRIFPVMYVGAVVVRFGYLWWKERRIPPQEFTFLKSFSVSTGLLVVLSLLQPGGKAAWPAFAEDIVPHSQKLTVKRIALPYLFTYMGETSIDDLNIRGPGDRWQQFYAMRQQRLDDWKWAIWAIRCIVLVLFVKACLRCSLHESILLGIALVFFFTNPVRYYYAQLVVMVLLLAPLLMREGAVWLTSSLFGLMIVMNAINATTTSYHIQQFVMSLWICVLLVGVMGWLIVGRRAAVAAGEEAEAVVRAEA